MLVNLYRTTILKYIIQINICKLKSKYDLFNALSISLQLLSYNYFLYSIYSK